MQYRQGDLLIQKIDELPPRVKLRPNNVVAYGEQTGHAHIAEGLEVDVYDEPISDIVWIVAGEEVRVEHDEHDTLVLPQGTYEVTPQRRFVPPFEEQESEAPDARVWD